MSDFGKINFRQTVAALLTSITLTVGIYPVPAEGAAMEAVTSLVKVTTANERSNLDSRTRLITSSADITITNISPRTILAPLHAVIDPSSSGVQMPGALGGPLSSPYNKYYYDLSGKLTNAELTPGKQVSFTATFVRNSTIRFTYNVQTYGAPNIPLPADLIIAKSHSGNFSQGQGGATYTIIVSNVGSGAGSGSVTVTDMLPIGLTATGMSGSGWSCTPISLTCSRGDALAAGGAYPPITLTVDVSRTAKPSVTNTATVSGGGETNTANNTAADVTTITPVIFPPDIQVTPSPLPFGDMTVGTSVSMPLTITNSGGSDLVIGSITVSNAPFGVFPPLSFTVAPGASRQVNVGFAPTATGSAGGVITISSNATNRNPVTINVSGNGIAPVGTPAINAPTAMEFGQVIEGQNSNKTVTVSNTGAAPLILRQANITGSGFSWPVNATPALPQTIAVGQSVNLPLVFGPSSGSGGKTLTGALVLASDGGSATVALSGNAVTPLILPPSQTVLGTLDKNGASKEPITSNNCESVAGKVQFGSGSQSSDTFIVTLSDQGGATVSSASFNATQGAGTAPFDGIAACNLKDGTIGLAVAVNNLSPATGTPLAKNSSSLAAPILAPVDPATVFSAIPVCGTAPAGTIVQIAGGSGAAAKQLGAAETDFCINVPLRLNTENLLIASATNRTNGQVATAAPVKVTQVDPSSVLIAQASSRPLTTAEVEMLVQNNVINLNDPSNFNVSMFTIVLTVGSFPVTISQPVVVNPQPGAISYGGGGWPVTMSGGGGGGSVGGGGGVVSSVGASQVVVIQTPTGQTIPGVIIIDSRIKTLKEFFLVTIAIQNTTTQFDLTNMVATIALPSGLTSIKAGLGTDVANISMNSATDTVNIGTIGPAQTGAGQFIVRGDGIGAHNVAVNFAGFLNGGGLDPFPISGSASTTVQVFGPPTLTVSAVHPTHVTLGQIYTLTINVKNSSQVPALYTSMDLLIGQGATLVDANGNEIADSSTLRNLGNIQPGQTISQSFQVKSKLEGDVVACQAVASEQINLMVTVGSGSCNITNTIPVNFIPPPEESPPTLLAINPLNNQSNVPVSSSVMATLTPRSACLTPDSWNNIVTDLIDPADPGKGLKVVSADLISTGTFYLEELDAMKNPVRHIPTDLTVTTGLNNSTTIATLRQGLATPLTQFFLKPNTFYRATIIGAVNGVCNAVVPDTKLATTFQWIFSTEQPCAGISAPTVTLVQPLDGSVDRPLNQAIILNFSQRMNPASFTFNAGTPLSSSFVILAGGSVSGGDVTGGTVVPGSAGFTNLFQTFTYTPAGNLPIGQPIHVRLRNSISDTCGQPLQTPPNGIRLLGFTTIPPDTTPPGPPLVNPLPALTSLTSIQVSGTAEPASTVAITGGASPASVVAAADGSFSVAVPLTPNGLSTLFITAKDASGNVSAVTTVDKNGAPLTVNQDATPPTVTSVTPAAGAANVARNSTINVLFSKNINPGTVNSLNFSLTGTVEVNGSFTLNGANSFTFTPAAILEYGRTYTIRLRAGGISDTPGNSLTTMYTSTFVTVNFPAPTLTQLNTSSGSQGTSFNVTFTGTNLATVNAVVSDNLGVSGSIISRSDTSVTAIVSITSQAATGPTTLGISTLGGTSKLPFTVSGFVPIGNIIDATYGIGAGSFELGNFVGNQESYMSLTPGNTTILGWTVGGPGGGIDWLNAPYWRADDGIHSVDLQSNSQVYGQDNGSIATFIPTGAGKAYHLTFGAAAVNGLNASGLVSAGSLVNQPFFAPFSPTFSTQTFAPFSFYFTATGPTTEIRFAANNPNTIYGPIIDSVSVVEVSTVPAPILTQMSPFSAVQGEVVNVTFTGTNLATVNAVVTDNPGVSGSIISRSDTSVTAIISITPQAAIGSTTLGLNTLGGSVKLSFTITSSVNAALIAHWGFDETGGTTAFDSVGGVNGTLVGGVAFIPNIGISGGAIQITDGYVTMGNNLASTSAFSVQAWVKIAAGDTSPMTPVAKHWAGIGQGYYLSANNVNDGYTQNNMAGFRSIGGPSSPTAVGGPPVNDGLWHDLVGVYNNGSTSLYVDGNLVGSGWGAYSNNIADFMVGGLFNNNGIPENLFHGFIDEVAIYNKALSATEVKALYNSSIPNVPTLVQLSPATGVQGTTINVTFTGTNLATVNAVVSDNPGVSGSIISRSDTSVVASITIDLLATIGTTTLRVTTLGGSAKLPFTIITNNIIDATYGIGAGSFELGNFVNGGGNPHGAGSGYMGIYPGDNTTITGWTVGVPGDGVDWLLAPWPVDTGIHSIDMQHYYNSSISTVIPTITGATYKLSFSATSAGRGSTGLVSAGSLINQSFTASATFTSFEYTFTATGPSTTVRLVATGDTGPTVAFGPAIDSVSVVDLSTTFHSCLDVRQAGLPDGTYSIDPDGKGTPVNVYCPASSPFVAPVGLCQAEAGATPACRSYVGAAGFNFSGVNFSKPLTYTGTVLTAGGTSVPGNRGIVQLGDGTLLTANYQSGSLNKIAPDGTLTAFGSGLTLPHFITPLFDKTLLIGGVVGTRYNYGGILQKSGNWGQTLCFMQSASGLVWVGYTSPGKFDLLQPDLTTLATTVTNPSIAAKGAGAPTQLANGNYVVSNVGNSYPTPYGGSLLFLKPDLTPLTFTQPPTGMTLNADGTISHPDLSGQHESIQLPNRQILIADFWTNKIIRLNEDGSFVDELTLGTGCAGNGCQYAPSGMILDRDGLLLVSTGSNQVRVITFGP